MPLKPNNVSEVVVYVVTCVWTLVVAVSILDHSYQIPSTVQLAMSAVIFFFFGSAALKRRPGTNGSNDLGVPDVKKQSDNDVGLGRSGGGSGPNPP